MSKETDAKTFDAPSFLKHLTTRPGVYRMLGADGEVLYVGKAKNLKKSRLQLFPYDSAGCENTSVGFTYL